MKNDDTEYVPVFKALADETRLRIVAMLAGGELCACNILENFNITQPTLSYHMKILTECGLVKGRRDGAWMRYTLNTEKALAAKELLADICNNTNRNCFDSEKCKS